MTPAGKWLTLGLTVTVLLGGSGGGAYYYHKRELRRAVETQEAALKTLREQAAKDLWRSRARSLRWPRRGHAPAPFPRTPSRAAGPCPQPHSVG